MLYHLFMMQYSSIPYRNLGPAASSTHFCVKRWPSCPSPQTIAYKLDIEFIFVGCFHFLYRSIYLLCLLVTWLTSLRFSFWLLYNSRSSDHEMAICLYFLFFLCRHVRTFMHVSGLGKFQMAIPPLLCTLMQLTKKIWMRSRKSRGLVAE